MSPRKPQGLPAFESLLGKLSKVPKRELDREVTKHKKRAANRAKRKK